MTPSALALVRGGPFGLAEELSSRLPWRARLASERWLAALHAARFAFRRRQVWSLEGAASVGGGRLRVVTDLGGEALGYWSGVLFDGAPRRMPLGRRSVWERLAMAGSGDLLLMSHHRMFRRLARRLGCVTVPSWLDTGIALAGSVEATLAAHPAGRRSRESDLRRIRRAGLRPAIVRGADAVREFVREWYLPFVHARWGDTCIDLDPDWRRRAERYCEVLWVMRGAERVAGLLLEPQGENLRMVVVGMRDPANRRDGALAAAYYFAIAEAVRRRRRLLRTGGTRPVLSDGVLEFKRKWGTHVRPTRQQDYLALGWTAWSPALRALFARHPVVVEAASGEFLALTDPAAVVASASAPSRGMLALGGLAGALVPTGPRGWTRMPLPAGGHYAG